MQVLQFSVQKVMNEGFKIKVIMSERCSRTKSKDLLQEFCAKLDVQLQELSEEADCVIRHQKLFGHACADFTELRDTQTEIEAKALLWNARGDTLDLYELWDHRPLSQVLTS
jgi:hypothetical protein